MLDDYLLTPRHIAECVEGRLKLGLSQRDIAEKLNYTPSNINMFEHGKNKSMKLYYMYMEVLENAKKEREQKG